MFQFWEQMKQHYLNYGKFEGRLPYSSDSSIVPTQALAEELPITNFKTLELQCTNGIVQGYSVDSIIEKYSYGKLRIVGNSLD